MELTIETHRVEGVEFVEDGRHIGGAEVENLGDEIWVYNFAIAPKHRGNGYAQKAMQMLIDRFGVNTLTCAVNKKAALHIYKKLGFEIVDEGMHDYDGKSYLMKRACLSGSLSGKYTAIFKLEKMLKEAGIECKVEERYANGGGGYILRLNEDIDAIQSPGSYGEKEDLLEIKGALTPEESDTDEILGWLTAEEVFKRFKWCYEHDDFWYRGEVDE